MRILVTGAAGFIGSHLCEHLLEQGYTVTGVDNFSPFYWPAIKEMNARALGSLGIPVHRLDLAVDDLSQLLQPIDLVVHLAAQPGISPTTPFDEYVQNNIFATHRVIEAACKNPSCQGLINISTSSVYGAMACKDESSPAEPISDYGATKLAAEQLVLATSRQGILPAASLRLYSVYGPRERPDKMFSKLFTCLLEGRSFPLHEGSLEHLRAFTYVGDIVAGIGRAVREFDHIQGEIINLGTNCPVTVAHAISAAEAIAGTTLHVRHLPSRMGDQQQTQAICHKAKRLLGWEPTTSLTAGLQNQFAWTRDQLCPKIAQTTLGTSSGSAQP